MTNEQLALLLRGYEIRVRALQQMAARIDTAIGQDSIRDELSGFRTDLIRDIKDLLGVLKYERRETCQSRD